MINMIMIMVIIVTIIAAANIYIEMYHNTDLNI